MTHRRKQRQVLENIERLEFVAGEAPMGAVATPGANLTVLREFPFITVQKIVNDLLAPFTVVATDSGGANGGFGSKALFTLPARRIQIVGSHIDIAVLASGTISASATITCSLGTAAEATNSTLDSTQADLIPSTSIVLSGSTGTARAAGGIAPLASLGLVNASGGTQQVFLNFGIPDAAITSTGALLVSGTLKLFYIELGL